MNAKTYVECEDHPDVILQVNSLGTTDYIWFYRVHHEAVKWLCGLILRKTFVTM